jgi:hypothetical protein
LFELPSDWLSQYLNSQSEGSSKQLLGFGMPGFVLLKLCYLYQVEGKTFGKIETVNKAFLF